jgi:hypothetical protein
MNVMPVKMARKAVSSKRKPSEPVNASAAGGLLGVADGGDTLSCTATAEGIALGAHALIDAFGVQGTHALPGGLHGGKVGVWTGGGIVSMQPVCAGFVWPMPWFVSHS